MVVIITTIDFHDIYHFTTYQINEILKNGLAVQLSVDVLVYVDPANAEETAKETKTDDASLGLKGTMYFGPRAIDASKCKYISYIVEP